MLAMHLSNQESLHISF